MREFEADSMYRNFKFCIDGKLKGISDCTEGELSKKASAIIRAYSGLAVRDDVSLDDLKKYNRRISELRHYLIRKRNICKPSRIFI